MKMKYILALVLTLMSIAPSHAAVSELESAQKLANMGVINSGSSASDFGLANTVTRKEIIKVVMNLSGKSVTDSCNGEFSDVQNDWGCKYIESALGYGYIAANATFRPDDSISKAEAMKLVLKAKGIEKAYNTSDWQADWMNTALDNGIIESAYSDHTISALRGWIFTIGASEGSHTMMDGKMEDKMEDTMMKGDEVMMDKKEDVMMEDETTGYLEYDASLLGSNETVVLFFNASWCPSCRAADSNFNESGVGDILLLSTDYDTYTDLRQKYRITYQHTFVQVDADGELIKKWNGSNSIEDILEEIQ